MNTTQNELLKEALDMIIRYKERLLIHSEKRPTAKESSDLIKRIENALETK